MSTAKFLHLMKKNIPCVFLVSLLCVYGCSKNKENHDIYGTRTPVKVSIDQMIFISTEIGFALIDITKVESDGLSYRWRSWNDHFEDEQQGDGSVKEEYVTIMKTEGVSYVLDTGSDLLINAGRINVLWTPNTFQSVNMFYHPEKASVKILDDNDFVTFNPQKERVTGS